MEAPAAGGGRTPFPSPPPMEPQGPRPKAVRPAISRHQCGGQGPHRIPLFLGMHEWLRVSGTLRGRGGTSRGQDHRASQPCSSVCGLRGPSPGTSGAFGHLLGRRL